MALIHELLLAVTLFIHGGAAEFMKGTNYGNMFIPEDWMASDSESIFGSHYGPAVSKPWDVERYSLCDVTDDRILRWLDDKVKESDFLKMQSYGVKLLRVPTGYWNWIDIGDATPNAPDNVATRFRNLQAVKPNQYEPYIDKIYQWAKIHNIKIFMELHGAPGSQNGEIHSGCVTGAEHDGKPEHYFNTDWNKEIAVNAIGKMAEKCRQFESSCWGIGVLNEPQPGGGGYAPSDDDLHWFLEDYYAQAINKAREYISWDMPVVLFSWTYDFWRWGDNRYPYEQYGKIMWDTHMYTPNANDVDSALSKYDYDLGKIQEFQWKQGTDVIVGEFAFSNLQQDEDQTWAWQQYVDRVFPKFQQQITGGALIWNFDCQYASWSMKGMEEKMHVQWNL